MKETSSSQPVCERLRRIAELARSYPDGALTTLSHHIDEDFLAEAFSLTRKDGATGVDGLTGAEYERDLKGNLRRLLARVKTDAYRAPPVRRAYIPKGDGAELRPLGIPTFEDKILQRAATMVLEAVYEQDFLDCSYGFRPGRNAHQALKALWDGVMGRGCRWLVEVDIRRFFDTVRHEDLGKILDQRIRDGVLRRLIDRWLKAGVVEGQDLTHPTEGTPQGGVISPILANIYLHTVLDTWVERDVKPRLKGRMFLIRYADDFVLGFEQEADARKVLAVLPKRFGRFGLALHPEKTRLIDFRSPDDRTGSTPDDPRPPEKFDLLAFTHTWGRTKRGTWVVRQLTSKSRFVRALRKVADWCREHRHSSVKWQQKMLGLKVRGHYAYFGVTGNIQRVARFVREVERAWWTWLNRRDQLRSLNWSDFGLLLKRFPLPPPCLPRSVFRP